MEYTLAHFEIAVDDVRQAANWYAEQFGWRIMPLPGGDDYVNIELSDDPQATTAAFFKASVEHPVGTMVPYYRTDDIDSHIARLVAAGAIVVLAPTDYPGLGAYARLRAPSGPEVGLLQFEIAGT